MKLSITHVGTACCLIQIDSFRILTDPVLDDAGGLYHHGFGSFSRKTTNPKVTKEQLQNIDLVLLSHPQHKDNFDRKGQELSKSVPLILSTTRIEKKFKNGQGFKAWEKTIIPLPNQGQLSITAVPAQHHPFWLPQFFAGEVIGFMLEHQPSNRTIYITGDTVYFKGIKQVAQNFPSIDVALIHVGSAEIRYLTAFGKYTMNAKGFVQTVQTVQPSIAIPIHNDGWSHFYENDDGIRQELSKQSQTIQDKVLFLEKGQATSL